MHETEEEQIEAIKQWWEENGKSVVIGLGIAIVGIFSWHGWGSYQETQANKASAKYFDMVEKLEDVAYGEKAGAELTEDYATTPYASLASLQLAKVYVDAGENDKAITQFRSVVEHASGELQHIGRLRLARLLRDKGELDEALMLLASVEQEAFVGLYADVIGDIYVAKGMPEKAAASYQKAIADGAMQKDWAQMKLDALARPAPTQ